MVTILKYTLSLYTWNYISSKFSCRFVNTFPKAFNSDVELLFVWVLRGNQNRVFSNVSDSLLNICMDNQMCKIQWNKCNILKLYWFLKIQAILLFHFFTGQWNVWYIIKRFCDKFKTSRWHLMVHFSTDKGCSLACRLYPALAAVLTTKSLGARWPYSVQDP